MTTTADPGPHRVVAGMGSSRKTPELRCFFCFLCVSCLFCGSLLAQARPAGQFVGHWRLVKFENVDEQGVARDAGYDSGRIMYDAAGNMSAQLMRSGRRPLSQPSTEAERAAAYSTFVAYYGKYTVDPVASKVTHAVEGALNTNWVKTDLVRYYEFSADGRQLLLSLRNSQGRVTATLTWERMQ